MSLDSTQPRRSLAERLTDSISQSLHAEITSARLGSAGVPWRDLVAMAVSQTDGAPPARIEPYGTCCADQEFTKIDPRMATRRRRGAR